MKKNKWFKVMSLVLAMSLAGCGSGSASAVSSSTSVSTSSQSEGADSILLESAVVVTPDSAVTDETALTESEENPQNVTQENISEEDAQRKAEEEKKRAEEILKTEEEKRLAEEAKLKAEEEKRLAEENKKRTEEEKLKKEQLNSFSMMYYLAITAEEIRTSKSNRLILDDIYTALLNDINPGSIDEITQDHLKNLRDIIKSFRNISTKRDRLQYIYNQNKAAAIRSAVPNPIAILSLTNATDWKKLATGVVYAIVDSYNNYKNASENADKEFLISGWELDDAEEETVLKNRDRAFDYMVDMVQEYNLDGLMTLNEKAIEKFAQICALESVPEKISRLQSEEETYKLLGNYWLELADCYFATNKYEKCLDCVDKYNELSTDIYRKDFNYVQILPKAIVAAQNIYSGDLYVTNTKKFADDIIKNTSTEDWSTRYFVAQVYLDLYTKTNDPAYLTSAYKIAYQNVTVLLEGQRTLNNTYLNDVQEVKAEEPDYRFLTESEKKSKQQEYKAEQNRAKEYNKALKETRKTELPTLYEPLVLNCELLFSLAEKVNISDSEKSDIEAILKSSSSGIFISKPINDAYSFSGASGSYSINFTKDDLAIPANLLTANSKVIVTVTDNNKTETFDDCTVKKVVRKGKSVDTFTAYYTSKKLDKYKWTNNSMVTITVTYGDAFNKSLSFKYSVVEYKHNWYGDKVVFGEA